MRYMQAYTDLTLDGRAASGSFGVGLFPSIAMVRNPHASAQMSLTLLVDFPRDIVVHATATAMIVWTWLCHSAVHRPGIIASCGMQVAQAGARLAPGDPDRTAPKVLKLRPWDRLRFLWRGSVHAVLSGMRFDLSGAIGPDVTKATSRLTVRQESAISN